MPVFPTPWRWMQEDFKFKTNLGKVSKTLSQKQNTNKKAGSMML
jgi:hypothetical protein